VRFPGALYAVITQTLAGFEHHHTVEIVGSEGAIRTWWSGTMDRTEHPTFELKIRRRGQAECETVEIGASGEVFELQEEIAQTAAPRPAALVSGEGGAIVVRLKPSGSPREGRGCAGILRVPGAVTRRPCVDENLIRKGHAMRLVRLVALGAILAIIAAAGRPATAEAQQKITLLTWNIPVYKEKIEGWIADFKKIHPDVTVQWFDKKGPEWGPFYQTQLVAGIMPDVIDAGRSLAGVRVNNGL
jgi:hypothetical protein